MLVVLLLVVSLVGCSSRTDPFVPCRERFREYREANRQCQGGKCDGAKGFTDAGMRQHVAERALEYCCTKAASTVKDPTFADRLLELCKAGGDVPWEPDGSNFDPDVDLGEEVSQR